MGWSHQGGWDTHYAGTVTHEVGGTDAGIGFVVSTVFHEQPGAAAHRVDDWPAVTNGRPQTHGSWTRAVPTSMTHGSVGSVSQVGSPTGGG